MKPKHYCNTQQILDKEVIKKSSALINKLIVNPAKYFTFSIDNICLTIPIKKAEIKVLKMLPKLIKAHTDLSVTVKELRDGDALAAKFLHHIQITNKQGHSFSILHTSLTNRVKNKSKWKHKHIHNEGKFDVNPNTFGADNLRQVLGLLQQLWSSYNDLISRSRLTSIDLAADIPELYTPHIICSYAYRSEYRGFVVRKEYTGFQFGKKSQCPIKCYNKSFEQHTHYRGHRYYSRFEKTYRPRVRKNRYIPVSALDTLQQGFRGLSFYDPKLLNGMPNHVLFTLLEYGIDKGKEMLSPNNRSKVERRMKKYHLLFAKEQKQQIVRGFQLALGELKALLLDPSNS